jgi:ribosomal protein L40E
MKDKSKIEDFLLSEDDAPVRYAFKLPLSIDDLHKYDAVLEKTLHATEHDLNDVDFHLMTTRQRMQLLGSGVRRLGFIVKTCEVGQEHSEFTPPFLDVPQIGELLEVIDTTRNITINLEQLLRLYTDVLLVTGDEAFRLALIYYGAVRDAARRGVPGAQAVFRTLEMFFRRGRRVDEEPTIAELKRDVNALLHGKKDGEVVIKGEAKHTTGSHREVVDTAHKPTGAFKEKAQGQICSQCGTENGEDYVFCKKCGLKL